VKRLPYPRLYLGMALYIGASLAAFVLIGALAFAAIAAWELTGYLETRNSAVANEAAKIMRDGGRPALETWLQAGTDIPGDAAVYVFDNEGADVLGRPIPELYSDFVASALTAAKAESNSNFRPIRLTAQIVDDNGAVYSVLIVPSNVTLFGSIATVSGLIAVALVVIAIVAWLIAGRIGRPIGELQEAVRNLAAGDIHARVPDSIARRRDELGQLAHDFNSMAEHLNQLIEGRERLMRELSHELRSPLTRLQAAVVLAASRNSLAADERERIDTEIERMNRVIGEILRYSALDNSVSMQIRLVRIDRLLQRLIDTEEIEAQAVKCELRLEAMPNLEVAGDPKLLNSAFENIVRNAIRYAPENSVVRITAEHDDGAICISVSDQGPGITAEKIDGIFEPYVHAGDERSGTGLGLAIVRRVIERHGGTVSAKNLSEGGLQVTATIPAADFN